MEKPRFVSAQEAARVEELSKNESAFLLACRASARLFWSRALLLPLQVLIFGIGLFNFFSLIALIGSLLGFLPEHGWLLGQVPLPSFTPTVFLFVAGTVIYGVSKYLQNEKSESEN
ncbi:hypothetical protein SASPL_157373 [Salvia splendens]|uniref:Uncharacterized protein n=1 Tax=Salvia splendens TaxID=180675 RepID=A0A8X8VV23_SALSN|nr:hypothetical protein SASPL_157373 [Salvia splendens]